MTWKERAALIAAKLLTKKGLAAIGVLLTGTLGLTISEEQWAAISTFVLMLAP